MDCFDCQHAAIRDWPAFTANCQGCMARALAGIKSLPVLDAPHPQETCAGRNCGATDGPHSPECVADHMDCLFIKQPGKTGEGL